MILEEKQAFDSQTIDLVYLNLFYVYMENNQVWDAFQVAKAFQVLLKSASANKRLEHEQTWEYMSAVAFCMVADHERANETLTKMLESESSSDLGWQMKFGTLIALANAYRHQGDFDSALGKYDQAIRTLIPQKNELKFSELCINRACLFLQRAEDASRQITARGEDEALRATMEEDWTKAYRDFDEVITSLKCVTSPNYASTSVAQNQNAFANLLARAYAGQAIILQYQEKPEAASEKLEKARGYAGNNKILLAKLKYINAHLYLTDQEGELVKAQTETREAAILYSTLQMELQDLDSAWISLLDGEMKRVFIFMQTLCIALDEHLKALLWAERGRMRLYFHSMRQSPQQDPLWFDKDDKQAEVCIHKAIKGCGVGTAIVEYTYADFSGLLYVYVAREQGFELSVNFQVLNLRDFFNIKSNSRSGNTLKTLIKRTRSEILKRADNKAKQGLSILYRLLVEPIWQYIVDTDCSTILFAPHENLSLVPFAALFNDEEKKFLIEEKAVGIIPSIRTLHQCLQQQSEFEIAMRAQKLAQAFVAADPQPMGLGLQQLKGAAEEASNVAKILGVEPLVGRAVTKQAVIDGLKSAYVSVLVTHGIVNTCFPHGALVVQGTAGCTSDEGNQAERPRCSTEKTPPSILNRSLDVLLKGRPASREFIDAMPRASEVLTADELGKLEGGIHAGLVVLSACQTGEGQVSSEGLLGLGRAVLQAGASSAALMLWKVDDDTTKDLVTELFRQLVDEDETIVASTRWAMLHLLKSGSCNIYNWAPLMTLGSPTVKLVLE